MKDKLVKFNHKAAYYRMKKFFLSAVLSASCFVVFLVPSYISQSPVNAQGDGNSEIVDNNLKDKNLLLYEVKCESF